MQNFAKGTVRTFSINLIVPLGAVTNIKVWHDSAGSSPHWFLEKVVVDDKAHQER